MTKRKMLKEMIDSTGISVDKKVLDQMVNSCTLETCEFNYKWYLVYKDKAAYCISDCTGIDIEKL